MPPVLSQLLDRPLCEGVPCGLSLGFRHSGFLSHPFWPALSLLPSASGGLSGATLGLWASSCPSCRVVCSRTLLLVTEHLPGFQPPWDSRDFATTAPGTVSPMEPGLLSETEVVDMPGAGLPGCARKN